MREDYSELLKKLSGFLSQIGIKLEPEVRVQKLREELVEKEKKFAASVAANMELQGKFMERERELKSLQKTNSLYEKRIEELQQKVAKLRSENARLISEESTALKIKEQMITDLKFRIMDLDKSAKEAKK